MAMVMAIRNGGRTTVGSDRRRAKLLATRHRQEFRYLLHDQRPLLPGTFFKQATDPHERRRAHGVAVGLDEVATDEGIDHAEFVLQEQEDDPLRRERLLTADDEAGEVGTLAGGHRPEVEAGRNAFAQGRAQELHRGLSGDRRSTA